MACLLFLSPTTVPVQKPKSQLARCQGFLTPAEQGFAEDMRDMRRRINNVGFHQDGTGRLRGVDNLM